MGEPSNMEISDHDLRKIRGSTITEWHVDNFAKKPYNVLNTVTEPWKIFWLYTRYMYCHKNAKFMLVGSFVVPTPVEFWGYPAVFEIKLHKQDLKVINVKIRRVMKDDSSMPDPGYFLRFCLEICGSHHPGMYSDMPFHTNDVCVPFQISECFPYDNLNEETVLKCSFWMYETTNLDTHMKCISQNGSLLQNLHAVDEIPENAQSALAFIMGCKNLNCMFSGRQDEEFVKIKILLLTRILKYSTIFAERLRCFEENTPFKTTNDIGQILGYIYCGDMREIHASECVKLHLMAFKYSFPFLKQETSFFLSENLTEPGIILDVIRSASVVDDWMLADVGIEAFFRWKDIVVGSEKWNALELHEAATIEILATKKENHRS